MNGLELARHYYFEVGRPALAERFPEAMAEAATGLAGEGSECFGYDDDYSRDHDYGPSFCLWLPEQVYSRWGSRMQSVYDSLPKQYLGFSPRKVMPQGQNRVGIMKIEDFYRKFTGCPGLPADERQWMRIPEHLLAQAVNGQVFEDACGTFTSIRNRYLAFYPEEIRWKKLAARAVTMAQSGQYNYPRSLKRKDSGAAFLALQEFIRAAISMVHLLNRRYTPYYKWMFRSFSQLPFPEIHKSALLRMAEDPLSPDNTILIEDFCKEIVNQWKAQGLTTLDETYLEAQGVELYGRIQSSYLRSLHILTG